MNLISAKIIGQSPLLHHSDLLIDPLHPMTKAIKLITSKSAKAKTEADHINLIRLEWEANMYYGEDIGPYIPADNVLKMIRDGAAKQRKGKAVFSSIQMEESRFPLLYDGPRELERMFKSTKPVYRLTRSVGIGKSRVIRTRPMFPEWSVAFNFIIDPEQINIDDAKKYIQTAGRLIGLGDWRPIYGRFKLDEASFKAEEFEF